MHFERISDPKYVVKLKSFHLSYRALEIAFGEDWLVTILSPSLVLSLEHNIDISQFY